MEAGVQFFHPISQTDGWLVSYLLYHSHAMYELHCSDSYRPSVPMPNETGVEPQPPCMDFMKSNSLSLSLATNNNFLLVEYGVRRLDEEIGQKRPEHERSLSGHRIDAV